jgi:hypothetical protein
VLAAPMPKALAVPMAGLPPLRQVMDLSFPLTLVQVEQPRTLPEQVVEVVVALVVSVDLRLVAMVLVVIPRFRAWQLAIV